MNIIKKNKLTTLVLILLFIVTALAIYWKFTPEAITIEVKEPPSESLSDAAGQLFGKAETSVVQEINEELPPGVNSEFYDAPEIQQGWMRQAETVLNNNLPVGVTHAELKDTFFNRGFKGWAVTCGEVRLYSDESIVDDFQRFVFPGVQTIYFENDIPNFDIYWDKVCVQTSDSYIPDKLK